MRRVIIGGTLSAVRCLSRDGHLTGMPGGSLRSLDLPPVHLLLVAALMWGADRLLPLYRPQAFQSLGEASIALAITGLLPAVIAAFQMFRARTTVHPHHQPEALVTSGIFALSRNPIYVTDVLLLAAWALYLGSLAPWLGLPLFIVIVTRRFIEPEEARLEAAFGESYRAYRAKVRRWI